MHSHASAECLSFFVFANCLKEILQSEQVYCSLLRGLNFQRQCISFLINGLNGGSTTARCSELSWQTVTMSHVVTTRHKEAEEDPPPPQDCPQCSNVPMFLQLTDSGGDCGDAGFHCCAEQSSAKLQWLLCALYIN